MSLNFMTAVVSAVILEPKKIKPATVFTVSPSICHEVIERCHDLQVFFFNDLCFLNVEF